MSAGDKFDIWSEEKKSIHTNTPPVFYVKPREIWVTKMGVNIGFEQDGKRAFSRPVVVLKQLGNLFFTIALTTRGKTNNRYYFELKNNHYTNSSLNERRSSAILSQVRVMDKKRFMYKMGYVSEPEFLELKKKLTTFLL